MTRRNFVLGTIGIGLSGCGNLKIPTTSVVKPKTLTMSGATGMSNPIRALSGLEPDKYSTNVLNINRGHLFEQVSNSILEFNDSQINLSNNGLWGLDTGSPSNGELYVYALKNVTSGDYGLIATKQKYEGDVTCPSGYQVVRKLPWGVMYNTAWDGIPDFHLAHWPSPLITLTASESSSNWCALAAGSAQAFTDVDLSSWIPDNARMAFISCQTRYSSATGSAYVRSYATQTTGQLVGSVTANCAYQNMTTMIRVTSDRKIQYKNNSSGSRLYIYVLGYCMTEPA